MVYNRNFTTEEIWAVLSNDGYVMWTNGGSSTKPKLMVYPTKSKADSAIKYFNLVGIASSICVYRRKGNIELDIHLGEEENEN
jgi:hypothetical protein